ncbi:MAG TPA: hypothetical protein EYP65_01235 [Armatimonadetes bacterium]|nr:hypothetical protein [Armatimonadota bacterium]
MRALRGKYVALQIVAFILASFALGCGANLSERIEPTGTTTSAEGETTLTKSPPPFLTEGISWEGAREITILRGAGPKDNPRKSRQFLLEEGQFDIWFFHALPGEGYSVTLVAWAGDPDLYVYYPERPCLFPGLGWVDWLFDITLNPVGIISFVTGQNYPYWFGPYQVRYLVVYACTPCAYSLYVRRRG